MCTRAPSIFTVVPSILSTPAADGKRKRLEFTATRSVRELIRDAAAAFGIADEGDVLLLCPPDTAVTLAGAAPDRRAIDAGLFRDIEARCVRPPKRVTVRVTTTTAALG